MSSRDAAPLQELAALHHVQVSYADQSKKRRHASDASLLAILRALGAPVTNPKDVPDALRERRLQLRERVLDAVYVAKERGRAHIDASIPVADLRKKGILRLRTEDGALTEQPVTIDDDSVVGREKVDRRQFARVRIPLPSPRPAGYHEVRFECGSASGAGLLIVRPDQCFDAETSGAARRWGTFLPLYALRTKSDWGVGDFSGLGNLVQWTRELGGDFVGTLPLQAAFLTDPCDFSPYSPVSRRFWNEIFLDVTRAPEWEHCPKARSIAESADFREERRALRAMDRVDYCRAMALKRPLLDELARVAARRNAEFQQYKNAEPEVRRYAAFRAACERFGVPWWDWPPRARDGNLDESELSAASITRHEYVQWLAEQQLAAAAFEPETGRQEIYLDFPLGVHPAGYDTWNDRQVFVQTLSAGAPPDDFFTKGQDWGLPPLHPDALRESGYAYFRSALAKSLRFSSILRIDHVMAFHRLFCVPEGVEPVEGAYVRFPANEFYAILALESQRHQTEIVGEDLGTVPEEVRTTMKRNGVKRMYVLQFSVRDDAKAPIEPPPQDALASLNTHDTPTFAGFFTGADADDRVKLGLLNQEEARGERDARTRLRKRLRTFLAPPRRRPADKDGLFDVLHELLNHLSKSEADLLLVNLEDLWLERSPQNVPGTTTERPNWQQKARLAFEQFSHDERVLRILNDVNRHRNEKVVK